MNLLNCTAPWITKNKQFWCTQIKDQKEDTKNVERFLASVVYERSRYYWCQNEGWLCNVLQVFEGIFLIESEFTSFARLLLIYNDLDISEQTCKGLNQPDAGLLFHLTWGKIIALGAHHAAIHSRQGMWDSVMISRGTCWDDSIIL